MLYPYNLSTIPPSTEQSKRYGNIFLYETSVISIMVNHFDYKHRCLIEKNVPIALILPSRWQYGAESLGMERTSCLWNDIGKLTLELMLAQQNAKKPFFSMDQVGQ